MDHCSDPTAREEVGARRGEVEGPPTATREQTPPTALSLDPRFRFVAQALRVGRSSNDNPIEIADLPHPPSRDLYGRAGTKTEFDRLVSTITDRASFTGPVWKSERAQVFLGFCVQSTVVLSQLAIPLLVHAFVLSLQKVGARVRTQLAKGRGARVRTQLAEGRASMA